MNHAKVLALVGEMDGCALWRILLPFSELQRQGFRGVEWDMNDNAQLWAIVPDFDAIILPRLSWPPEEMERADKWFQSLHRAGKAIIYEVDDDLFTDDFVRRLVNLHGKTPEQAEMHRGCIMHALKQSDGVTVSGQRLASIVRQYTDKPVKVVPNFIDLRWFKRIQKASSRVVPGLSVGWAGGNRPDADVEIMGIAWGKLAKKYPHVNFVVQGHHAKAIYDNVPKDRIGALDWMPIDSYPAGLVNFDIGCCPLGNTPFNRAKTPIKAMEYAASGAAVVASPTVYDKLIEHGYDGFIAETVDDWEAHLSALIEDYTLRHAMSKRLLAKVRREHSLERHAWKWLDAWTEIVSEYREKTRRRIYLPKGVEGSPFRPAEKESTYANT